MLFLHKNAFYFILPYQFQKFCHKNSPLHHHDYLQLKQGQEIVQSAQMAVKPAWLGLVFNTDICQLELSLCHKLRFKSLYLSNPMS